MPAEGYALLALDYAQIEYRIYASYSKDEQLAKSIHNGLDIHKATASIIFNKPYDEVEKDERQKAKTINFALIYGVGINHLAELLNCSESEARIIKETYFSKLPTARIFINTVHELTGNRGYIRNYYHRRRRLAKDECFKAPNALIQGCAADFMKNRMLAVSKALQPYRATMLNVIHDCLMFEVPYEEMDVVVPLIKNTMEDKTTFRVPIEADCEWSMLSWGTLEKYDVTKSFKENLVDFNETYPEVTYGN